MRCDVEMEKSTHVGSPHSFTQISVLTLMAEVPPKLANVPESEAVKALVAVAQPTGSSTTLIDVAEAEKAPESMPAPPAKREIVLGLYAPSAAP